MNQGSSMRGAVLIMLAALGCNAHPALIADQKVGELLSTLQVEFGKSVDAEKSAVLATTDEESQAFANESRRASAEVERARIQLHAMVSQPDAVDKLKVFDDAWEKVVALDARILPLAVANTNLKATRLSSHEAQAALDEFIAALTGAEQAVTDAQTVRMLASASVDALRIQTLHAPHIAAAEDTEMTTLEAQMQRFEREATAGLVDVEKRLSKPSEKADLATATAAWQRFLSIHARILDLSRQNSNVVSFDLSTHAKRQASVACQAAIEALAAQQLASRTRRP